MNIPEGNTPKQPLAERNNDLPLLAERLNLDSFIRAAVLLGDDKVLRDIDKPAGKISGFCRPQRRIRKSLTSSVSGEEVLQHIQSLTEVSRNRIINDASGGIGHQSANTRHLRNLTARSASTGIYHHAKRVGLDHMIHNFIRNTASGCRPENILLVDIFVVGQNPHLILRGEFKIQFQ